MTTSTQPVEALLKTLKDELSTELSHILSYWMQYTPDEVYGGFLGRIDNNNVVIPGSPKGSVLNARILWSFSAAYNLDQNPLYLQYADRAYQYITDHVIDKEYGGVYWLLDHGGQPLDTKKQVYASAFAIYGLSEYYMASGKEEAKSQAIDLYKTLVSKSFDTINTGYLEAFTRDWQPIEDLRLSDKDANEKKTMNTHLHVLEAYTNLYRIWADAGLKEQIEILLDNFITHFIGNRSNLALFFDEEWNSRSGLISYGHDIEATWLLQEAAEVIEEEALIDQIKKLNVGIAEATIKAVDTDGGMYYEYEPNGDHLVKEKHWWVQAEAMVGYFNTWQITGDEKFLALTEKGWQFVKAQIIDTVNGEWFWGIDENGAVMAGENKAGMWKCPYHNSRACIEIIKRVSALGF